MINRQPALSFAPRLSLLKEASLKHDIMYNVDTIRVLLKLIGQWIFSSKCYILDTCTGNEVVTGQLLAKILHPYESELIETLYAPVDGKVFFIHNEPLTYANTAVIKLV